MFIPFTQKYRPRSIDQLVLPPNHGLEAAFKFIADPFDSAWFLRGKSGLGKSSLAEIMAAACAHPLCIRRLVGPDLDSGTVADIASKAGIGSVFSTRYCFIVEEADGLPPKGQKRLLDLLEHYSGSVWIFTSNEELSDIEPRFLSRCIVLSFTNQGIAEPAMKWITKIAGLERLQLDPGEAETMIRKAKNNLRAALQALQVLYLAKAHAEEVRTAQVIPSPRPLPIVEPLAALATLVLNDDLAHLH
jgi:replication-associated recombination protein RarA